MSNRSQAQILEQEIARRYPAEDRPCLCDQLAAWTRDPPLKGARILDASPLFFNTLAKLGPLLAAGAEVTVGLHDALPHDPEALALLRELDIPIARNTLGGAPCDIVLDCAGRFAGERPTRGFVELTRSGERLYADTARPCLSVDRSRIKLLEDRLGTADGLLRALAQLGIPVAGRRVLLFGFGKVGAGIAARVQQDGASLTVVEDSRRPPAGLPADALDFRNRTAVETAARTADLIVTATGLPHIVCGPYTPEAFLRDGVRLINMGVEDEFGPAIPADRVLNRKRPLNFILEEPTRLRYLDATFALHNACALDLFRGEPLSGGLRAPPAPLETQLLQLTLDRNAMRRDPATASFLRDLLHEEDRTWPPV